jgi:hypothetical protein
VIDYSGPAFRFGKESRASSSVGSTMASGVLLKAIL